MLLQSKDFNNRIVGDFFHALVRLPKSFFDRRKTGDMIARMNDTARIQRNIAYITGSVFIDIIVSFITCFFLLNYSLIISLIVFCFIPVLVFTVLSYTKPIKNKQRVVMVSNALNESNYIDTIQGITVIKSQNKEVFFINKIRNIYGTLQQETLELGKIGNNFSITHRVHTAKITDRIYILEEGIIKDSGTPMELSLRSNFYSQLIADVFVA